jgi:hypothetical protein
MLKIKIHHSDYSKFEKSQFKKISLTRKRKRKMIKMMKIQKGIRQE